MDNLEYFKGRAWAFYEKAPRPLLRWVCIAGAAWVFGVADLSGFPMESASRGVILTFIAAVYGLRGWEKLKQESCIEE